MVRVIKPLLTALAYLHEQGIIHRYECCFCCSSPLKPVLPVVLRVVLHTCMSRASSRSLQV